MCKFQNEFGFHLGEEEKLYWEKLKADRDAKMNTKHRLKKRGTSKVMFFCWILLNS